DLKNWWLNPHHNRVDGVRQPVLTEWVPQSKPFRFTEYGCAAIDKGANQPNRFLDAKSSESGLPRASNGRRDDLMQMQYLRAMRQFWTHPGNNGISILTGQRMLDLDRSHVWAWDARPFPAFPGNSTLWTDAENYSRGHWVNGRSTSQPLSRVISEICSRAKIEDVDVSQAYGLVRGYSVGETTAARSSLQALTLAYGIEAVEREGRLRFQKRDGLGATKVDKDRLVVTSDMDGSIEVTRAADAETMGRIRVSFVEAEGDFAVRTAEAIFPDDSANVVSESDLPLALTATEARDMAERWLAEARIARDSARFALPKSAMRLGAGDRVEISGSRYRIDRLEHSDAQAIEAVRVEAGTYVPGHEINDRPRQRSFVSPLPVYPLLLDLPMLTGNEVPHAPHVAVTASPWPGPVAIWTAPTDEGYLLNRVNESQAIIGITETELFAAPSGLWDRGAALRVRLLDGALSSASTFAVLNGANVAAIGDGQTDIWEVLQFADAELVAPSVYDLRLRLRGQAGTDGVMPVSWPLGSVFVLLDGAVQQIQLAQTARGLSRFYRFGAASRSYDDRSVVVLERAFNGIGMRPYSVGHLRVIGASGQAVGLTWTRRTRLDGDSWQSSEVPLGEDREAYLLQVRQGSAIRREVVVTTSTWSYPAATQMADGVTGPFDVSVSQISDRFGPGPARSITVQ
ncbi:MAG: baseplate multidomain protein megatron, partial [Paracoccaceae bacterium]